MIYLFDDKESRQQSYGWTNNKFELWSDVIVRIKDYSDYLSLEEQDILYLDIENKDDYEWMMLSVDNDIIPRSILYLHSL